MSLTKLIFVFFSSSHSLRYKSGKLKCIHVNRYLSTQAAFSSFLCVCVCVCLVWCGVLSLFIVSHQLWFMLHDLHLLFHMTNWTLNKFWKKYFLSPAILLFRWSAMLIWFWQMWLQNGLDLYKMLGSSDSHPCFKHLRDLGHHIMTSSWVIAVTWCAHGWWLHCLMSLLPSRNDISLHTVHHGRLLSDA